MNTRRGFTLIELLVVIAIIAILAAILFPVFAQAKEAARKTTCISNNRGIGSAVQLYMSDYDEFVPLVNYRPCTAAWCSGTVPGQSNWIIDILPYVNIARYFRCPSDMNATDEGLNIDPVTGQAPTTDYARLFAWTTRANYGMNSMFLCPMVIMSGGISGGQPWPMRSSAVKSAASTIFAVESIWDRAPGGEPTGGGNWALDPPCTRDINGALIIPFPGNTTGYYWFGGWNPTAQFAWNIFGGAWPWHAGRNRGNQTWMRRNEGTAIVVFMDSHAKAMKIDPIAAGCDVRPAHTGRIFYHEAYLWDLR